MAALDTASPRFAVLLLWNATGPASPHQSHAKEQLVFCMRMRRHPVCHPSGIVRAGALPACCPVRKPGGACADFQTRSGSGKGEAISSARCCNWMAVTRLMLCTDWRSICITVVSRVRWRSLRQSGRSGEHGAYLEIPFRPGRGQNDSSVAAASRSSPSSAPRRTTENGVHDIGSLRVRIADVAAALAARTYGRDDSIVFDVEDRFCPSNSGRYRLDGGTRMAERTSESPDIRLAIEALGSAYLGGISFTRLSLAGSVVELRNGALDRADALFHSPQAPWCPEIF